MVHSDSVNCECCNVTKYVSFLLALTVLDQRHKNKAGMVGLKKLSQIVRGPLRGLHVLCSDVKEAIDRGL